MDKSRGEECGEIGRDDDDRLAPTPRVDMMHETGIDG